MKISTVTSIPLSDPVPEERQHRNDLGTKVKSESSLVVVETDDGLRGIGAALGNPAVVNAIIEHDLGPELLGEDPIYTERLYEKMYTGSRFRPSLETGVTQPVDSRRRGVTMEAISGLDIALWDI